MKKLITFLLGLVLMTAMVGMIVVVAAIYDTASQQTIDSFFFQPGNLSSQRIGVPARIEDLSDEKIREMLVDKFITEYFYVVPDVNNINTRISGTAGLARLVSPELFAQWTATIAPEISDMAAAGMMRTARVIEINMPEIGDRWQITYELHTWTVPNDLSLAPIITRGTMMVKMRYEPGFWKDTSGKEINIGHELETGRDPSTIFKFRVFEIENME